MSSRLDNVLKAYGDGALNVATAQFECAMAISVDNVDAAMAVLPPEIVAGLRQRYTGEPTLLLGNQMSDASQEQAKIQLRKAAAVLRDWFARRDDQMTGGLVGSPPSLAPAKQQRAG